MSPEQNAKASAVLDSFELRRLNGGEKPKPVTSKVVKMLALMSPDAYGTVYLFPENVKMFPLAMRREIGDETFEALYLSVLAGEWPA